LFYLICFGIVYGSLFPFQFSLDPDKEVVRQFMSSWRTVPSRGDILGNIALFVPFGFAAYFLSIEPGRNHSKTVFFVLTWLVVAAGSQVAQFIVPSRDPSIFDLYGNAFGAILGWILARLLPRRITSGLVNTNLVHQVPVLLVLLWVASELIPFVPTIDFQAYKDAVKPLFLRPQWSWYDCLMQTNSWVVCFTFYIIALDSICDGGACYP
jgi:glycopeptide antibiotics resistance protein